ncbi:hypothetical protein AB0N62_44760, partial [Streptomyces sp. NPDC093982]|uniref:hypothetical protein n=1 Tax=Streptomyces sp. NPDC093982 TaxID=3155077 RepID=UPI00343B0201
MMQISRKVTPLDHTFVIFGKGAGLYGVLLPAARTFCGHIHIIEGGLIVEQRQRRRWAGGMSLALSAALSASLAAT